MYVPPDRLVLEAGHVQASGGTPFSEWAIFAMGGTPLPSSRPVFTSHTFCALVNPPAIKSGAAGRAYLLGRVDVFACGGTTTKRFAFRRRR